MKYFELKCLAYIKKEIELNDSFDVLSSYINYCFLEDQVLKKLHGEKDFKNYCLMCQP